MHACPKTLNEYGCIECLRARTHLSRVWTHRIYLESLMHDSSIFITLTYSNEELPPNGSLVKDHFQKFLKRYRTHIAPRKIRIFYCGEYGDKTARPHYHAIIFGASTADEPIIRKCWPFGSIIDVQPITLGRIRYIAGYCQKKLIYKTLPAGCEPEFREQSRKPGIGALALPSILATLKKTDCQSLLLDDVPKALSLNGKLLPLGEYMRNKLREDLYDTKNPIKKMFRQALYQPHDKSLKQIDHMQDLQDDYGRSSMSKKADFLDYHTQKRDSKNRTDKQLFQINQLRSKKL